MLHLAPVYTKETTRRERAYRVLIYIA